MNDWSDKLMNVALAIAVTGLGLFMIVLTIGLLGVAFSDQDKCTPSHSVTIEKWN